MGSNKQTVMVGFGPDTKKNLPNWWKKLRNFIPIYGVFTAWNDDDLESEEFSLILLGNVALVLAIAFTILIKIYCI